MSTCPPVIVIGMHRSGTTMMTRCLSDFGLFPGWRREPHTDEAYFFLRLNDWMLNSCGANWDNPQSIKFMSQNDRLADLYVQHLKGCLSSFRRISFLGPRLMLSNGSVSDQSKPWTWKDPRNTFTLPIWLRIFPDARILHIRRHGLDVAKSLQVREIQQLERAGAPPFKFRHQFHRKQLGFVRSPRCLDLREGLKLWDQYLSEANEHVDTLGNRALELDYEQFLEAPTDILEKISEFCHLDFPKQSFESVAKTINPERAFVHRRDNDLAELARAPDVQLLLNKHGYN